MSAYLQQSHQTSHQGHSHGCHTFPSLAQVTDRQTDRQKTVSLSVRRAAQLGRLGALQARTRDVNHSTTTT